MSVPFVTCPPEKVSLALKGQTARAGLRERAGIADRAQDAAGAARRVERRGEPGVDLDAAVGGEGEAAPHCRPALPVNSMFAVGLPGTAPRSVS